MKILVKLGGTLLDSVDSRQRLAGELAALRAQGLRVVVVHGGGKQMTRFLSERGVESKFVCGLRVSTPEVIDAVLKVLAGTVNHELVASLVAAGALAVGLSGIDACLTEAEPMHGDLGAVGRPVRSNAAILELLAGTGYLPVVACVAGDKQGNIYNVNADQMAVACASGYACRPADFLDGCGRSPRSGRRDCADPDTLGLRKADYRRYCDGRYAGEVECGNRCVAERNWTSDHCAGLVGTGRRADPGW